MLVNKENISVMLREHKEYFEQGQPFDITFRLKQLKKLHQVIGENEKLIMDALYKDLGKCEFEAYASEVGYSLDSIRNVIKNLKSWAKVKKVPTPIHQFGAKSYIYPEPYGTVLIVGPYNYPFQLVIEPLVGAMAAGNCAILKPSESTPNVTNAIKKIISENFDEKYIRVVEGEKEETSALINAPFDYIFFTGSVAVGKIVMQAAGKNLVPVTLELGGKSPCIVDKTTKIDIAVKRILWGKFMNAGQTCVAPDYVVVHKDIKDKFINKMIDTIINFYGEDPINNTDYGRIINQRHMERLVQIIEKDKNKIIHGGTFSKDDFFISPTFLDNIDWKDASMQEEIFGPILPIMEYTDLNQVIKMINQRPKPLALYLFSEDKNVEQEVLTKVSSGGGCVNDTISHISSPHLPFGGVGHSGIGSYHGKASFDTFSHKKSVLKKTTLFNIDVAFPPYKNKIKVLRKILK